MADPLYTQVKAVIMATKNKHIPVQNKAIDLTPITEKDRLEYMIQLNKNAKSKDSTNEIDEILDEQIKNLKIRVIQTAT